MTRTSKAVGLAIAVALLTSAMALPAQAAQMDEGRRIAVGPVAKEAVREILAEAGLGQAKIGDREERISQGLVRLVEAGIIEDANVKELVELAKQGRLGQTISERARATNNGRADAARAEHKPTDPGHQADDNGSAANRGKPDAPGDQGSADRTNPEGAPSSPGKSENPDRKDDGTGAE